jgi:hypothetical protein
MNFIMPLVLKPNPSVGVILDIERLIESTSSFLLVKRERVSLRHPGTLL